jgi:hypothetical protein
MHLLGLTGFVGLTMLFMLVGTQTDQHGRGVGTMLLATFASVGMFLHAASSAGNLVKARKTLENLRAPAAAWTPFLRGCLRDTSLTWLVLAAALMVQLALRPAPKPNWLGAAALVSLAACMGMLYALCQSDLLPRLRKVCHPAAAFAAALLLVLGGPLMLDTAFTELPGAGPVLPLALAALCWPALAGGLLLHWRGPPTLSAPGNEDANVRMLSWLARMRRYSLLKRGVAIAGDRKLDWHSLAGGASFTAVLRMMNSTGTGDALTANHLLGMAALVYQAYHLLAVRDLHWRSFLAPGGMRQRDIAMSIFTSTLHVAGPVVLCMFALLPMMDILLGFSSFDAAMHAAWRHSIILAEIPLVIAAAVVVKGMPQPYAGWFAAAAWMAAFAWAVFTGAAEQPLGGMKADFAYLLLLAAATALLLLGARRLWTPRTMLVYLKLR